MDEQLKSRIQEVIAQDAVVLFMKGSPRAPQCGFSAKVVQMLDTLLTSYATVDVLQDAEIRQGIKEFSSWPTIPQLYVKGKFVGGCDIVSDLFADGSLADTLGVEQEELEPPAITVSDKAAAALKAALGRGDEVVRLGINPRYDHELMIGPPQGGDINVEVQGLTVAFDPMSARRAGGLSLDFVDTPKGKAFKIDNPNAPPKVKQLSPEELKERLAAGSIEWLVDVRSPAEREIARIEGSRLLDQNLLEELSALDPKTPVALVCHHGMRSQSAAEQLLERGFREVYNVTGGIDAWSQSVDPSVPRY